MKATHQFVNSKGHTYQGVIVAPANANACWFLCLCDDGKTWMKVPVWAIGVMSIAQND